MDLAHNIGAQYIVALTYYGFAARMIARYRPVQRVIAMTPNEKVASQLLLSFGCNPVLIEKIKHSARGHKGSQKALFEKQAGPKGDKIVIVAGMPLGKKRNDQYYFGREDIGWWQLTSPKALFCKAF